MCGENLIKWRAFMRKYLIFHERWILTMDRGERNFYKRNPLLFILEVMELRRIAAELFMHFWSSFAFAIHSSLHIAQNFIQINMHMFLAQFSFTHSQLNLHTSFQISLHSHVDQSLLNPSFSQGLVAFTSNLMISNKATPFRQKATGRLAG